jgi:hypothetical protein
MKFSLALVLATFSASGFAMTSSAVAAGVEQDDMILVEHEGLLVFNHQLTRDFNAEEASVINSCMMSSFNEIHDPAIAKMQLVEQELTNPVFKNSMFVSARTWRVYPSLWWSRQQIMYCRFCDADDCDDTPTRLSRRSQSWLCTHPEEAKALSPQQRFQVTEALGHIEWEAGTCDCLVRSGLTAFADASDCKLTFSPVNNEIPLEAAIAGVVGKTLSFEPPKDDKKLENHQHESDFIYQSHESVVLFNTQTNRDLNDEENYFLDHCLIETFNGLHEDSGSTIDEVATEVEEFVMTNSFVSDLLSTVQKHLEWNTFRSYGQIHWKKFYMKYYGEIANFLSDEKRTELQLWQQDFCSCLISGEMEGFKGVQSCQITFPPTAEQGLRGSTSKAE